MQAVDFLMMVFCLRVMLDVHNVPSTVLRFHHEGTTDCRSCAQINNNFNSIIRNYFQFN